MWGPKYNTNEYLDECYKLENRDWKELPNTLAQTRSDSGVGNIVINDKYVLVSGGGNTNFQELVPLDGNIMTSPMKATRHSWKNIGFCIIQLNESSVLITGGIFESEGKTQFQNFDTNKQEDGPDMVESRQLHACGKIKIGGKTVLIVVGGYHTGKSWEYLDLESSNPKWVKSKAFLKMKPYLL